MTPRYITIQAHHTRESILSILERDFGIKQLMPLSEPQSLMGNFTVLSLKVSRSLQIIKLEGPAYIVHDIYLKILESNFN
jgi:hypothetical protein